MRQARKDTLAFRLTFRETRYVKLRIMLSYTFILSKMLFSRREGRILRVSLILAIVRGTFGTVSAGFAFASPILIRTRISRIQYFQRHLFTAGLYPLIGFSLPDFNRYGFSPSRDYYPLLYRGFQYPREV